MQNSRDKIVIPLVLLFTLIQVGLVFLLGYTPYPDSNGYIALARESLAHGSLYPVASQLNHYAFLWNSGAINAVAASLWLTGSVIPLLVVYAIMKGATAWLLYLVARQLLQPAAAFIALLLYLVYPANYGEATSVLSEVPFIFFAMLAVWLCVTRKHYFLAGIFLALGNWIRPFSIVFLAALLIFFFFNLKKSLRLLAGYVAAICIIGSLTYFRTGLFLYQSKTGWMALMQYSWDQDSDRGTFNTDPSTICHSTRLNVSQKDDAWRTMFFSWLSQNKWEYISQMPAKLANTYVSDNVNLCAFLPNKQQREYMYEELSLNTLKSHFPRFSAVQWLTVANLLFYYVLLLTAGLSLRRFHRRSHLLPLAIILVGTLMLLFVGHGEARFHQPFMPFVIMLSAIWLSQFKHRHG